MRLAGIVLAVVCWGCAVDPFASARADLGAIAKAYGSPVPCHPLVAADGSDAGQVCGRSERTVALGKLMRDVVKTATPEGAPASTRVCWRVGDVSIFLRADLVDDVKNIVFANLKTLERE